MVLDIVGLQISVPEFIWTIISFFLFMFLLNKFLFKPVMKIISDRQKEIDDLYADAGAAKEQARQLQESYQQKLNAAQETSDRIVKEAVARGQSREEQIIRDANAQAAAIMDKASRDIAQEKKKAINDAKNEISDLAMAIAGKVVERELKESDQASLIDGFIRELGDEA